MGDVIAKGLAAKALQENKLLENEINNKVDKYTLPGITNVINNKANKSDISELMVHLDEKAAKTEVTSLTTQLAQTVKKGELMYNVRDYGAKGDANYVKINENAGNDWFKDQAFKNPATDDTAAIEKAIQAAGITGGTIYFPPGRYRVTRTLKITTAGITFTGSVNNNFSRVGGIVYDGEVGGNLFEIGSLDDKVLDFVSPVNFNNLSLSSSEKAAYLIHANASSLTRIEKCHFRTALGAIYAPNSWYMGINDCRFISESNYTPKSPKILDYIPQSVWDKISKGYVYLSAFNAGSFNDNKFNNLYVKRGSIVGHPRILTFDGANGITITNLTMENLFFSHSLVNLGYDGVSLYEQYTGSNSINGMYIENVSSTATGIEGIFQIGKNYSANLDVNNVFCYNVHAYLWIRFTNAYNSHIKVNFKNVHFADECSFQNVYINQYGHKVQFIDCFMLCGKKTITETDVIFEPYVGDTLSWDNRKSWDNRLGINTESYIVNGQSYIQSGLSSITSGSDAKGKFIDVVMDGQFSVINGMPVLSNYKYNGVNVKVRLRPTNANGTATTYYLYLTQAGTLVLKTSKIPATYAIYLAVININSSGAITVDTNVRKPPHSVINTKNGVNIVTNAPAPPTSGDWTWGDIVYNNNPYAGSPLGWICVNPGTPGTWKSIGTIQT